jgi:hypothetical protein
MFEPDKTAEKSSKQEAFIRLLGMVRLSLYQKLNR